MAVPPCAHPTSHSCHPNESILTFSSPSSATLADDSSLCDYVNPADVEGAVEVEGCDLKVEVAEDGIIITCPDGNKVCAGKFQTGKKVLPGA